MFESTYHSSGSVSSVEELGDDSINKVVDGVLVNIVHERDETGVSRAGSGNSSIDSGEGSGIVELPVVGIKVGVDNMVSAEGAQAVGVAVEIRGTDISRALSDDVVKGVVEGVHLGGNSGGAERREVRVGPSMRGDLMSLVHHPLNNGSFGGISDRGAPVLAVDEESSLDTASRQDVEKVGGEAE